VSFFLGASEFIFAGNGRFHLVRKRRGWNEAVAGHEDQQRVSWNKHERNTESIECMMVGFNQPWLTGRELEYIREALDSGHLSGNGPFTKRCQELLVAATGTSKALLTHSCTAALEMAVMLAEVGRGDEVILPSFTFVSTANAVVLRGGVPVFVDIRPDTLNMDEELVESAVTERTRAIMSVHYAGVGCEMRALQRIAVDKDLRLIEDAAQGVNAKYRGRALGTLGDLGALSFHETKNVISGEGGALLVNDPKLAERAEIIWEKGTNRSQFFRGEIDKYTWVDIGSSYLPGEVVAAFLLAQLESAEEITRMRLEVWNWYYERLKDWAVRSGVVLPFIPDECRHNGHIFYVLMPTSDAQEHALKELRKKGIQAVFHYVPLHFAPMGRRVGRMHGSLSVTDDVAARIIRLPIWPAMNEGMVDGICNVLQRLA